MSCFILDTSIEKIERIEAFVRTAYCLLSLIKFHVYAEFPGKLKSGDRRERIRENEMDKSID